MIEKEELLKVASFKGLTPKLAELDYLQDIALFNISREFGSKIAFKGGTCLYKVFQLNRFSEDLDFTVLKGFRENDFFKRLPFYFKLLNINTTVKVENFDNTTNVLLFVNGPSYNGSKESRTSLSFNLSFRERVVLPLCNFTYKPLYSELRTFNLFAMDEREILAEKIRAIYQRNKARDVFDIWYLLKTRGTQLDVTVVNKKLESSKIKFNKGDFLGKISEKKESWEKNLSTLVNEQLPPFVQVKREIEEKFKVFLLFLL